MVPAALAIDAPAAQAATPAAASRKAARRHFDPADPASLLHAYRKVLFAGHEKPVFWWMKGTKYGIVDNVTTPFYGMEIATILRCQDVAADRFDVLSIEIVYYTDLATGALLERWQNPYTSEWLDMKYVPVGPTRIPYSPAGPQMPKELPGAKIESTHSMGPATVVADDVWIRNDSNASVTRTTGAERPFLVHDWAVYHASLRDIEDDAVVSAPATVSFIDITSWPPSFKMGDRPGTRMSRAAGRKVDEFGQMPESFRTLLQRVHPEIHRDPAAALVQPTNRFER
jgi:hypothetical protein